MAINREENQTVEYKESWHDAVLFGREPVQNRSPKSSVRSHTPQSHTPKVAPQKVELGRDAEARGVARLLAALQGRDDGASSAELLAILALKSHKDLHVRFLIPAMSRQWIEYTIPAKPRSRLQRYRLTPAGRAEIRSKQP